MLPLLTAAQMRAADLATIEGGTPSRTLMERAAHAALDELQMHFDTTRVVFFCGCGNNGGDGLAMARFFAEQGGDATVCYCGKTLADGTPDKAAMSAECAVQYSLLPPSVRVTTSPALEGATAAVDAIFGIGLARPIEGVIATQIQALNQSGVPMLAIDIPSGLCADTGKIQGIAVRAARTVAIAARKRGHLLYPAAELCGTVTVADIGIPVCDCNTYLMEQGDLAALPPRPARAHKGTFGRVLIIGGAVGMSGAGYLAAKAAYRAGAGLVEILSPIENRIIYQTQLPEALLSLYDPSCLDEELVHTAIARANAIAIGMGLSCNTYAARLLALTLEHARVPLVVDADALNLLAADHSLLALLSKVNAPLILTPHLGEMSRLAATPIPTLASDLPEAARKLADQTGAITVLKDARTAISDGHNIYLNIYGNNGMATGGSGDTLAGIIAAFAASGTAPIVAATRGVLAHALAGDKASERTGTHGLMASDIADALCDVLP